MDVLSGIIKIGKEINYNTYMLDVDEFISTGNLNFNRLTLKFVKEKKNRKSSKHAKYIHTYAIQWKSQKKVLLSAALALP